MDILEEKAATLAKAGSFYYRSVTEQSKSEADFMSHLSWQTKIFEIGLQAQAKVLSKGYIKENFKIIHFNDLSIDYFGLKELFQERVHATVREVELIPTPIRPSQGNPYDYTPSPTSIMVATWRDAELGEGLLTPSGKLRQVEFDVIDDSTNNSYLEVWEKVSGDQFILKGRSLSTATLNIATNKLRWKFTDTFLSGNQLKFTLTEGDAATTIVNHLDNETVLSDDTSVIVGVVPEAIFYIEGATVSETLVTARPANLKLTGIQGITDEHGDILADENSAVLLFPGDVGAEIPETQVVRFGLTIDKDIFVTSIQHDTRRLLAGQDFISEFGKLIFPVNPLQLFPEMKFMAYSFIRRMPNLYNYSLRLNDVYGPVDKVLRYYRVTQSPEAFYKAAAQAADMAVVREDCKIKKVLPLFDGKLYITDKGEYEAPYRHTWLQPGNTLPEGTIIGGDELFQLILPEQALPDFVASISLDGILPVNGLEAPNETISMQNASGAYRPSYSGSQEALQAYWDYLSGIEQQLAETATADVTENAIQHIRQTVCKERLLIACINFQSMSYNMQQNLLEFLRREMPVGSVLTTADLNIKIS